MTASLIRLTAKQNESVFVDHPVLKGAPSFTEADLEPLTAAVIEDPSRGDELVMALRFCVSRWVGRYLFYWSETYKYQDEMVSEGLCEISRLVSELSFDLLAGRGILKVASQRIKHAIEKLLNEIRFTAARGFTQQRKGCAQGEDPVYLYTECEVSEFNEPADEDDIYKRDIIDAMGAIEAKDEIDAYLLCPDYWGKTEKEMAELLDVSQPTIHYRKKRLYNEFLKLTR